MGCLDGRKCEFEHVIRFMLVPVSQSRAHLKENQLTLCFLSVKFQNLSETGNYLGRQWQVGDSAQMDVFMCSITTRNDNLEIARGFVVEPPKDGHFYSVNWSKLISFFPVSTFIHWYSHKITTFHKISS